MPGVDEHMRLVGDEDCGVGIECGVCWRGGRPVGYYSRPNGFPKSYVGTDVVEALTVSALVEAGAKHLRDHHPEFA